MRIARLVSFTGTLTPMFIPLHTLFLLPSFSTNKQSTLPSLSKLMMDYTLLSMKTALLSIDSSKKLEPTMLPTPNEKRHIKNLSPPI
jgi:hypothetical protein